MTLVHNVQGHVGDCLAASPAALTRLAEWVKGGSAAPLGSRLDASALVVRRGASDVRLKGKGGGRGQEEGGGKRRLLCCGRLDKGARTAVRVVRQGRSALERNGGWRIW